MRAYIFVPRLRRSYWETPYPDLTVGPIHFRPFGPVLTVLQLALHWPIICPEAIDKLHKSFVKIFLDYESGINKWKSIDFA
jgi:hypothetical protein